MSKYAPVLAAVGLAVAVAALVQVAAAAEEKAASYAMWQNGPPKDPAYFPIGVWLQDPRNAGRYKAAGINLYIGLWQGPKDEDLAALKAAGMQVICDLNEVGLKHLDDRTIAAWMHGDEPDNAQSMEGTWKNDLAAIKKEWPDAPDQTLEQYKQSYGEYGPPIPPSWVQRDYGEMRKKDPTRPVYLNLGTGVAADSTGGRGTRAQHPEDYYEYCKGCDIVSYDIYPERTGGANKGKLWLVAKGVKRLCKYCNNEKIVWNIIEGSRNESTGNRPTPQSLRTEAWMSIIHGSRGIIYFVHLFSPTFAEAGVLNDPELLAGMTALHKEIQSLAPVINSPTVTAGISVTSSVPASQGVAESGLDPIAVMMKKHDGAVYLFSVRMEETPATGTFRVEGLPAAAKVEVLGENRQVPVTSGTFSDEFKGYDVHLYKVSAP
jgi:hypothetical protein